MSRRGLLGLHVVQLPFVICVGRLADGRLLLLIPAKPGLPSGGCCFLCVVVVGVSGQEAWAMDRLWPEFTV